MAILRVSCAATAVAVVSCVVILTASPDQNVSPAAARLLDAARTALGIEPGTQGPAALRMTGVRWTSQIVSMDREGVRRVAEGEDPVEVLAAFPDRYVETRVTGPFESRRGFAGTTGILRTVGLTPGAQGSNATPSSDLVHLMRIDLTRLAAGMLARIDTMPGLAVSEAAPNAVKLDAAGASDQQPFNVTLEFDPATRLPVRLVWRIRTRILVPGTVLGSGGGGAGPVGPDAPEETLTMTFSDRREVGGFRLPHRVSVTAKDITLWELRLTQIAVNPSLTDEDFR